MTHSTVPRAPLALFCKSFRNDLEHFIRLTDSVERHNPERIPFLVSVPRSDLTVFHDRCGTGRFELVADEDLLRERKAFLGWVNQQLVKLSAWRLQRADAMLMLDSDFRLLRDVRAAELFEPGGKPRIVLSTVSHTWELAAPEVRAALAGTAALPRLDAAQARAWGRAASVPAPRSGLARHLPFRSKGSAQAFFARPGPALHTMAGPLLAFEPQRTFHEEYLRPSRLSYKALLRNVPWEFNWLAEWALARHTDGIHPMPPPFLHFRSAQGVAEARAAGITRETIAREYLGVALAARHNEVLEY